MHRGAQKQIIAALTSAEGEGDLLRILRKYMNMPTHKVEEGPGVARALPGAHQHARGEQGRARHAHAVWVVAVVVAVVDVRARSESFP